MRGTMMDKREQRALIKELELEAFDLVRKCVELIDKIGWNEDDTYTFDDGDRWAKFNPEEMK